MCLNVADPKPSGRIVLLPVHAQKSSVHRIDDTGKRVSRGALHTHARTQTRHAVKVKGCEGG